MAIFVHNAEGQKPSIDNKGSTNEVPIHGIAARTAACLYLYKNPQLVMNCINLVANQLSALVAKEHRQADSFVLLLARLDPVAELLEAGTQTSENTVACEFGNG